MSETLSAIVKRKSIRKYKDDLFTKEQESEVLAIIKGVKPLLPIETETH